MSEELKFNSKIENLLGLTVEIVLNNNKKIKGDVFTINEKSKIIILINKNKENKKFNISMININEIKKIELSKEQMDINTENLCQNDLVNIKVKEKRNLEKDNLLRRGETEPNFKRGLEIYENISKFFRCSYDGKKITLEDFDSYIEEPFKLINLYCKDEKNKQKLEKIISSSIKKKK